MRMTIDNAIETIEYLKTQNSQLKSLDMAVDIMLKYQRIQAIVEAWKADVDIDSYDCMADICEVVEENDDCN